MASVNQTIQYFAVVAKCGHSGHGRGYYVRVEFAVIAESGSAAAAKVRRFPRVKHHHKDAILSVRPITEQEFTEINDRNDGDPFLLAQSIQEQRRLIPSDVMMDRLMTEVRTDESDRLVTEESIEAIARLEASRLSRMMDPSSRVILFVAKTRVRKPYRYYHYWPRETWCLNQYDCHMN